MAVLIEWDQLKMTSFLMITLLTLCMTTVELMAQPENCKKPLGMENKAIQDNQITASSVRGKFHPYLARLNDYSAWRPQLDDYNPWIQVDFEQALWVTGVATQGYSKSESWVTAYYVEYTRYGIEWQTIKNSTNQIQIFQGNVDSKTEVRNHFTSPISLQNIRIRPTEWSRDPAVRLELHGCAASDLTTTSPPTSSIYTEQVIQTSAKRTASTPPSKTTVFDLMTADASSQEFGSERSLNHVNIGLIIGVAVGSCLILLVGSVAIVWWRKKVKAEATQQPSAKDNKTKKGQDTSENSAKFSQNQDNYEPYRKGSEQATYEELQKSQITNGANSENLNLAGKHESVLYLEPMETTPSSQSIKSGNQETKPGYPDTRLGNLNEGDQTYEEINKSKKKPDNQKVKPGNQETNPGYQGESDQTYEEINKGGTRVGDGNLYVISQDPSINNTKPVQNKSALKGFPRYTNNNQNIPVYGNATVLKFVGK